MPCKTTGAAVVAIPPRELWEPIQAIRRRYDRHLKEWMPHVTLLYPFRPWEGEPPPELAPAAASVDPILVTLAEFRGFRHGPTSHTIWLSPEPAAALVGLHRALVEAFPDCDDTSRYDEGFVPHLSVGQAHDPRELLRRLQRDWRPIPFELESVALIARDAGGVFHVQRTFPLRNPA